MLFAFRDVSKVFRNLYEKIVISLQALSCFLANAQLQPKKTYLIHTLITKFLVRTSIIFSPTFLSNCVSFNEFITFMLGKNSTTVWAVGIVESYITELYCCK